MSDFTGMNPYEIAAQNTREALTAFWGHPHIDAGYYTPARLGIYQAVAEIAEPLMTEFAAPVADVGCGDGMLFQAIITRQDGADQRLEGFDWAETAISRARARRLGNCTFETADFMAGDLAARAGRYLVVLCIEVLEHIPDTERALDVLCSLTRPDGYVLLTVPNGARDTWHGHIHRWTADELRELLADRGLVSVEAFGGDGYLAAILRRLS